MTLRWSEQVGFRDPSRSALRASLASGLRARNEGLLTPDGLSRWPKGAGGFTYEQLLAQAVLDNDFENGTFFWNGQSRQLSDLTANGDGSYDLAYGSWFTGKSTVLLDYENTVPATVSGNYFSWVVGTSQRVEFEAASLAGGDDGPRLYVFPAGATHDAPYRYPGASDSVSTAGRRRFIATIPSAGNPRAVADNWAQKLSATTTGTLTAPTKLTFGRNARFGNSVLTNATYKRVMIWDRELSPTEIDTLARGPNFPIHLLGDSFLNSQALLGALANKVKTDGYAAISQDGVGGTSLTQQAARFALNTVTVSTVDYDISKWKDSTLIIMDGGMDGNAADAITAIDNMRALLRHDRWLYVEPAPQDVLGSANRIAWDATQATIAAYVGDRLVPTYDEALAAGNGSGDDNTEIAKGLWPLSLKTSTIDFHPSTAGYTFLGLQIYNKVDAMGWLP